MVPTWFGTLPTSFGENTVTRIPTSTGTLRKNVPLVQKSRRASVERSFFAECPWERRGKKRSAGPRLENRLLARKRLLVLDGGHVASSLLKSASNAATIHATILRKWHHTTPTRNK
jgi:hypothetical protein